MKRPELSLEGFVQGVLSGDRSILARAITLVESNSSDHQEMAQQLLHRLMPYSGRSLRVGVSGVPGAGKSTFIEALGTFLCEAGRKVAVLAVDPSSARSGGSILGDKTRMEKLSQQPGSFIRPSPSGGILGGVARRTRESMVLCEAAGFDVILVETVGVGQSEAAVHSMVDFFLLITIAGAGDEMQHIKRGVLELVDAVAVNKADGDNVPAARHTQSELSIALHYACARDDGDPQAFLCSSLTGQGIPEIWELISRTDEVRSGNGLKDARRREQLVFWMEGMLHERLRETFLRREGVQERFMVLRDDVREGRKSPAAAVEELVGLFAGIGPASDLGKENRS